MAFILLEKPIGADPDYEAHHFPDAISIGGPDGLMFKVELMAITHIKFRPNGEQLRQKIEAAINAVLFSDDGVKLH